jgi:STE24 endopeptidase
LAALWVFLVVLHASGGSRAMAGWWSSRVRPEPLALLGYLTTAGLAMLLILLPLEVYGSWWLERRFGLSRLTFWRWCLRELKQLILAAALSAAMLEALYALLRHAPSQWPWMAAIGWGGLTVVLARIFPTMILPIFYRTVPLQDEGLARRLLDLCRRHGLSALGVFRLDLGVETRKANAALAGWGKTRRVLLSDTLLDQFTSEEVEGVLAHEVAHHRYRHLATLVAVGGLSAWLAFALTDAAGRRWAAPASLSGLSDPAGFPLLMLWFSALGLVGGLLQNGLSRTLEWQADRFAVRATGNPAAFAAALRRLAELNLADPHPPRWVVWWLYDHPPITERIQAAESAVAV